MSRTVTLLELRTRSRELADQENSSTFIDDAELNAYINASLGRWHSMVAHADPERYGAEDTITATGATSYALPADYLATLAVDYKLNDQTYIPIIRSNVNERNFYRESTNTDRARAFRLYAGNIILMPNPTSGEYRHLYVTHADVLASDGDTVDGVNGWEAWIYYDAAIKCMLKEQSDPSALIVERNKLQGEIERAAQDRDLAAAHRVTDTRTRHRHAPRRFYDYYELLND